MDGSEGWTTCPVWTIADHCIESVGHRNDGDALWDLFTHEAIWVACSIPAFMVPAGNRCG